jgi:hypothetical protein
MAGALAPFAEGIARALQPAASLDGFGHPQRENSPQAIIAGHAEVSDGRGRIPHSENRAIEVGPVRIFPVNS